MTPESARDTYWDPHLSRSNLAEPVFGDIVARTGLQRLVGAGRVLLTVDDDAPVQRYLLLALRAVEATRYLVLGRPEGGADVRVGQVVRISWSHGSAWFGARVHVVQSTGSGLVLQQPDTVYRFPVRDNLWSSIDKLARLFSGFDVALENTEGMKRINHEHRIVDYLDAALEHARPALLYVGQADTVFPGRLEVPAGVSLPLTRAQSALHFRLAGSDMVGLSWRAGLDAVINLVVRGDAVAFRTRILGGEDARVRLEWPHEIQRRQRRHAPRFALGARRLVEFEVEGARTFRVLDISLGGAALVFEKGHAERIGPAPTRAEAVLYGRLRFPIELRVVDQVPFGKLHVRYCCAFPSLDARRRKAIEVLCRKLTT